MMYFENCCISTRYYSILLKDKKNLITVKAAEMIKDDNRDCYCFYIDDNLVSIIPSSIVFNVVED